MADLPNNSIAVIALYFLLPQTSAYLPTLNYVKVDSHTP